MIYTSYFAQMRNFPKNYIPVAICGGIPEWYTGKWYRKPAPKLGFFQEWKRNHDNAYYIEHYNAEVLNQLNFVEVLNDLQLLVPEEISRSQFGHRQMSIWCCCAMRSPRTFVTDICSHNG